MKALIIAVASLFAVSAGLPPAMAAEKEQIAQAGETHVAHGVVKSVDPAAGKVNIAHEPIESLGWPAMGMNFKAHDPALLKGVEPGQKVEFDLVKFGNEYRITKISPVQ